jgi:hypothetical protein
MEQPTPTLDIVPLDLFKPSSVSKFFRDRKIPLDRVAIVNTATHQLYIAEDTELSAVHDPYTGDQVEVYKGIQNYIGDYETLGSSTFHTVFLDPETNQVCDETGLACKLVPVNLRSWTSALLELTFGK